MKALSQINPRFVSGLSGTFPTVTDILEDPEGEGFVVQGQLEFKESANSQREDHIRGKGTFPVNLKLYFLCLRKAYPVPQ